MNVFRTTVVFICFVATKGNFPAVIFDRGYFLSRPALLEYSETEMEVGFDFSYGRAFAACPLSDRDRSEKMVEKNTPASKRLIQRKMVATARNMYLDLLPTCKSPPQVTSERIHDMKDYERYSIGYEVYDTKKEYLSGGHSSYSSQDKSTLGEVFALDIDTATRRTTSVMHELKNQPFCPTASSKKRIVVYEKNENFFKTSLDELYHNFVKQILPRMEEEKSKNQLAHALGIQKLQLATPDDFVLDTWKMATYWDINTVPIWRVLLLRWNAIEIYLRTLHKRGGINIKIRTGVSETFELAERYYDNNTAHKLHIPKYLWKLIPETYPNNKAMLIIMHNDPFTEHQEPLCQDICAINGWLVSNDDYRTGLVYCCEISENIAKILKISNDTNMKDYGIYSFTKNRNGTEDLNKMSRILSDLQDKLYDWEITLLAGTFG